MKGSIVKRGKSYSVVIDAGRDENGKRVRRWHSGIRTKREAEALRVELLSAQAGGTYIAPNRLTVREFVEQEWLPSIDAAVAGGSMKPNTAYSYRRMAQTHILPTLGSVLLRDVSAPMLNKLYGQLLASGRCDGGGGLSKTSVRLVHVTCHKLLRDGVKWGRLTRNAADQATAPVPAPTIAPIWSPEQMGQFLTATSTDRLAPMWRIFATTGLRRGEVAGLKWSAINLETGSLTVDFARVVVGTAVIDSTPKSDKSVRCIGLDAGTVAILRTWRARQAEERLAWGPGYVGGDLVFGWEDGRPFHPQYITNTFQGTAKRVGLPVIRLHGLRHSYATAGLEADISMKVMSERLGHSSLAITADLYSHVRREVDQAAANKVADLLTGYQVR